MKSPLLLLLLLALPVIAHAQSTDTNYFMLSSSPSVGSSPHSVVAADVNGDGKVDLISANNSDNTLTVLINVVQTADAPMLSISHSGNAVTVSWQNTGSWTLQQNADLASTNGWANSSGVTTSNGTNSITISNLSDNWFFRLKQ